MGFLDTLEKLTQAQEKQSELDKRVDRVIEQLTQEEKDSFKRRLGGDNAQEQLPQETQEVKDEPVEQPKQEVKVETPPRAPAAPPAASNGAMELTAEVINNMSDEEWNKIKEGKSVKDAMVEYKV